MRVYREHAARRRRLRYFMGMGEIPEQMARQQKLVEMQRHYFQFALSQRI